MSRRPKHMLIELPTADEIDDIAITSPRVEVRKIERDLVHEKADLNYVPCKGQIVVVIRGEEGVPLVRGKGSEEWKLPTDRITPQEDIEESAKRVAKDQCGLMLKSTELAGIYDVIWHYADVSIKRLHFVYAAITDDRACAPSRHKEATEARFFKDLPESVQKDEIQVHALTDCSAK